MFIVANNVRMKSSAEAAVYAKCRSNWTNCVFYSGKHVVVVLQKYSSMICGRKWRLQQRREDQVGCTECKAMSVSQRLAKWADTGCRAESMTQGVAAGQHLHSEWSRCKTAWRWRTIRKISGFWIAARQLNGTCRYWWRVMSIWERERERERERDTERWRDGERRGEMERESGSSRCLLSQTMCAWRAQLRQLCMRNAGVTGPIVCFTLGNMWLLCCRNIPAWYVEGNEGYSREEKTRTSRPQGEQPGAGNVRTLNRQRT